MGGSSGYCWGRRVEYTPVSLQETVEAKPLPNTQPRRLSELSWGLWVRENLQLISTLTLSVQSVGFQYHMPRCYLEGGGLQQRNNSLINTIKKCYNSWLLQHSPRTLQEYTACWATERGCGCNRRRAAHWQIR